MADQDPAAQFFPDQEEPDLYGALGLEEGATADEVGKTREDCTDGACERMILTSYLCTDQEGIPTISSPSPSRQSRHFRGKRTEIPADRVRLCSPVRREEAEEVRRDRPDGRELL